MQDAMAQSPAFVKKKIKNPAEFFPQDERIEVYSMKREWTATKEAGQPRRKDSFNMDKVHAETKLINGKNYRKCLERWYSQNKAKNHSTVFYRIDSKGYWVYSPLTETEKLEVPFPVYDGQSIEEKKENTVENRASYKIISKLVINGVTYKNCLRRSYEGFFGGQPLVKIVDYYARGIGLIKYSGGTGGRNGVVYDVETNRTADIKKIEEFFSFPKKARKFRASAKEVGTFANQTIEMEWKGTKRYRGLRYTGLSLKMKANSPQGSLGLAEIKSWVRVSSKGRFEFNEKSKKIDALLLFPVFSGQVRLKSTKFKRDGKKGVTVRKRVVWIEDAVTVAGRVYKDCLVIQESYDDEAKGTNTHYYVRSLGLVKLSLGKMVFEWVTDSKKSSKPNQPSRFCSGCGRKFARTDKFCGSCGRKRG